MGLKGGSGAMRGTDGYDHIGMIDASGGVLDQDYEMFEQQTPHTLIKHELLTDSAGAGEWRGGLGVETIFEIGSDDTQLVTFGDGDFEPAFGLFGGGEGGLNFIRLHYPDGQTVVPKNKDLITGVPMGTRLPPGRQRRRRLRRPEEARPQAAGRGDPQWRDHPGSGDAGLRVQRVNAEMKPSCATVSARSRRQGALLRSMSPVVGLRPTPPPLLARNRAPYRHDPETRRARVFGCKAPAYPARGVGCPIPASKGGEPALYRPGGHGGNRTPGTPGRTNHRNSVTKP
jgi:hypothetical protein